MEYWSDGVMHLFRCFATLYSIIPPEHRPLACEPAECHSAESCFKVNSGQNVRWAHRLKVCVPLLHQVRWLAQLELASVIPSGVEGSRCASFKVTRRDPSTFAW